VTRCQALAWEGIDGFRAGNAELFGKVEGERFKGTAGCNGDCFPASAGTAAGDDDRSCNRFLLAALRGAILIPLVEMCLLLSLFCAAAGVISPAFQRTAADIAVTGTLPGDCVCGQRGARDNRRKRT